MLNLTLFCDKIPTIWINVLLFFLSFSLSLPLFLSSSMQKLPAFDKIFQWQNRIYVYGVAFKKNSRNFLPSTPNDEYEWEYANEISEISECWIALIECSMWWKINKYFMFMSLCVFFFLFFHFCVVCLPMLRCSLLQAPLRRRKRGGVQTIYIRFESIHTLKSIRQSLSRLSDMHKRYFICA